MKRYSKRGGSMLTKQSRETDADVFLQPWFLPKDVYFQIRRILPNAHLSKMRYYFEDYGCLRCGIHDSLYGSNGLCERCSVLIRGRVTRALKRRLKNVGETGPELTILQGLGDGMTAAQDLLYGLRPRRAKTNRSAYRH
jgi:hypothetical protein